MREFPGDTSMRTWGLQVGYLAPGEAVVAKAHPNPHGGFLEVLSRVACALARTSRGSAVALSCRPDYLRPLPTGVRVGARAEEANLFRPPDTHPVVSEGGLRAWSTGNGTSPWR